MTDAELISYCDSHCETPVGLISKDMIFRLCDLAGIPQPDEQKDFYNFSEETIKFVCELARKRLAAKSLNLDALVAKKYKSKYVELEALELTEDNHEEVSKWCKGLHRGVKLPKSEQVVRIETLEGEMTANVGDFVIKGLMGEFYPCKPDVFHKKYEILNKE